MAVQSYLLPKFRGGDQNTRLHSAGVAERSSPTFEVRGSGQEELPHTQGQGWRLRGATHVQGVVAAWAQEGPEELLHFQGQEGWP